MFTNNSTFKAKKKRIQGFTLAELLVVVGIIGVLVAVSIPIFTSQLERSREATDFASMQAAKAAAVAAYYKSTNTDDWTAQNRFYYDITNGKIVESTGSGVPAAYGKGTAKSGYDVSSNKYYDPCQDQHYNPETDYTDKIIVAFVDGKTMHVHWVDGSGAGSYTPSGPATPEEPKPTEKDDNKPPKKDDPDKDKEDPKPEEPGDPDPGDGGEGGDWPSLGDAEEADNNNQHYEIDLIRGAYYSYNGKQYISINGGQRLSLNKWSWSYPGTDNGMLSHWFIEIGDDNQQIAHTDDDRIANVKYGAIYTAADGTKYIYNANDQGSTFASNPEKSNYDGKWIKIVDDKTSWDLVPN